MPSRTAINLPEPARSRRARLAFVALLCLFISGACITSTVVTEVVQRESGENLIGQTMVIEYNKKVWDALESEDKSQMGAALDSMKAQGWTVTTQEGGRIQTANFAPAPLSDLEAKGWKVAIEPTGSGQVMTATWQLGSEPTGQGSGLESIVVNIDQSDPSVTRYKYQARVVVQASNSTGTSGSGTSGSCGDDVWCQMIADAVATAEADPKQKKLAEALKEAGPAKVVLTTRLPGNIESATVNGSAGGNTSGNQVTWQVTMDKAATYDMVATASGPGAGSNDPNAFGVTLACNEEFEDDPGKVICSASAANAPQDAEIEYEWKLDGAVQSEKGATLERSGVTKGEHTVTVVAIATNQGNLRSDPTSVTFTKVTGAEGPTASATIAGPTATATPAGGTAQGAGVTIVTDENCGRKSDQIGILRVSAVPAGVDPANIPLAGSFAPKVKLSYPFPVYYGQSIQLPKGAGWKVTFSTSANSKTVFASSDKAASALDLPCDDGIAARIAGGVVNKWGDASIGGSTVGELQKRGINSKDVIDFFEGVVGPAAGNKKNMLAPGDLGLGVASRVAGSLAAQNASNYNYAYSVDASQAGLTIIKVYRGEVFVFPNNPDLSPTQLMARQGIEVGPSSQSDVFDVTDEIGPPPVFEDEQSAGSSGSTTVSPAPAWNAWLVPGLAVLGGLVLILLVFMVMRRGRRVPARASATAARVETPTPTAYAPPPPPQPQDQFSAVEAQYHWARGELAAGRMPLEQYQAMLMQMSVRDGYGRTWMLDGNTGGWLVFDGRAWVRADPRRPG